MQLICKWLSVINLDMRMRMVISGYRQFPFPLAKYISLGCAYGNKSELGAMETAYIPHNHTLTV